jgi:RNA polymerase sigma factor (sigma-70 family)
LQEADALDAIQTTWLRLAENAHRVRQPERLAGWLATTARRECLHTLRHAKTGPNITDWALETVSDPSAGPEQRAIDTNVTRTLRDLIDELPPLRRNLILMLFTDGPCSYAEIAHVAGIPLGGIGPTRARALRQLRDKIDEHELGPISDSAPDLAGRRRTASPPAMNSTTPTFSPREMSLASSSRTMTP